MRLILIVSLLLLALPTQAQWERARPRSELPTVAPLSDSRCRAFARRIDAELLKARDTARARDPEAGMRIVTGGEAARQRFAERCIQPRGCPAFAETKRTVTGSDQPVLDAYELMLELCGRQDGQK